MQDLLWGPPNKKKKAAVQRKLGKLTVLVHARLEALPEPARPALVPVGLVDGALALQVTLRLARVHAVAVDAALEEP
ncbi:hypothetical protein CDAR_547351 [Caerostris darwini]|uniref:Uncharacterized protein n=1 Tax=Caerostris darwini TaxID=1538125 RepID=A0AAV4V7F8_9ARAC|nr:hypothetical protein CDAR_547351 [Caerostris darwini]